MSSVSFSSSFPKPDFSAIRKQFDKTIDNDVKSGKISSVDAKAIKSAEDDIAKSLGGSSSTSSSDSASFDPSQLKTKVDSLIDGEVKSGKLTSAQADELKSVLKKGPQGGPGGAGGPPPGGPPGGAHGAGKSGSSALDALFQSDDSDDSSTDSTKSTPSSTSTSKDLAKLLDDFIKQLQSSSSSSKSHKSQPQLVDYLA